MKRELRFLSLLVLLIVASCSNASDRKRSINTTIDDATSTAPSSDEVRQRDAALVRFANALPGSSMVDLSANTAKTFSSVGYKSVTPYKEIQAGRTAFFLRPAGIGTVQSLAEESENLSKGSYYTAIALAGESNPSVMIFEDKFTQPAQGKAALRIIHASLLGGKVDAYLDGKAEPIIKGQTFKKISDYTEVDAGNHQIQIRPDSEQAILLSVPDKNIKANGLYTLILTGRAKGTQDVEAILIEDLPGEAH